MIRAGGGCAGGAGDGGRLGCSDAGGGEGSGSDGGSGSGATNAAILGGSRREPNLQTRASIARALGGLTCPAAPFLLGTSSPSAL